MANLLSLFPARVKFVQQDGTLTPEAYRALQILLSRVGGALGDAGIDTFGDVIGQFGSDSASRTMGGETTQPLLNDFLADIVLQGSESTPTPLEAITPSGSPYTYTATRAGHVSVYGGTVSQIDYIRAGTTTTLGGTSGTFPVAIGDGVKVTYTVAPTMKLIPR